MRMFKNIGISRAAIALAGFLMLVALGCRTHKPIVTNNTSSLVTKDSIAETRTERFRAIPYYRKGDTVKVKVFIPCDTATNKPKNTSGEVKGKDSSFKYDIVDGVFTATAICNELRDTIQAKDIEINRLKESLNNNTQTIEKIVYVDKPTPYIPAWVYWLIAVDIAVLIFFIVRLIINLRKAFKNLPY